MRGRHETRSTVAADGWLLYYYAEDAEPGDATGQTVGGVWWVLHPDGSPVRESTSASTLTSTSTGGGEGSEDGGADGGEDTTGPY